MTFVGGYAQKVDARPTFGLELIHVRVYLIGVEHFWIKIHDEVELTLQRFSDGFVLVIFVLNGTRQGFVEILSAQVQLNVGRVSNDFLVKEPLDFMVWSSG